jgi:hypothetical protein
MPDNPSPTKHLAAPRAQAQVGIKFFTGAIPGHDQPTRCHSGTPAPNKCDAESDHPGRDGWTLVHVDASEQAHRNGWWCSDCTRDFQAMACEAGWKVTSSDIPLSTPGRA